MNAHERTDRLYQIARKNERDEPTETEIADAIHDAEEQREQDIHASLVSGGFNDALAFLDKLDALEQLTIEEEQRMKEYMP